MYNYRVFAENAAGVSNPSNVIGPLLADDPHGEIPDPDGSILMLKCPVNFFDFSSSSWSFL